MSSGSRSNLKLAIGVVLVALVALGVWMWKGSGRTATPRTPAQVGSASSGSGSSLRDEPSGRTGDLGAPQAVMIDDDPAGTLRLEGQVVDGEDHPVAGATVVLSSNPPRITTSEQDGGFAFDGLVARPYTLVARAQGGVGGPVTARLTEKSDPVVLKLHAGAKLTVNVVGPDQQPVEKATVELRGLEERREATTKGTAVFADVTPGGYQLVAWADGMAKTFDWIQIGGGDAEARIVLAPGARVTGKVVDESGAGVAGARVRFSGASDWSQQGNDRLDGVLTGEGGAFEFAALPAGSFRFIATHPERAPGTSNLITLDGKTARDGVTIMLGRGAVVSGRVVDAQQRPVASARVRVGVASAGRRMTFEAPRQAYSDAKGTFVLRGLPRKPLVAVALHETGSSKDVPVDASAGDTSEVVLVLDVTGTIAGIVVDPAGQPLEGVQVSAGPSFGDNRTQIDFAQWRLRGFPEELTDAAGRFALTGLAAGSYMVGATRASSSRFGRRGFMSGANEVAATTGDTNLRIVLQPEGAIKGKVAFGDGTSPAAFTVALGMTSQTFAGNGEFAIDALPPQRYELTLRGPSFKARSLQVLVEPSKTADVGTITVAQGRVISGYVMYDGKPVGGATVHAGRLVFGNGSSSNANMGPMGQNTKRDTTDETGEFELSGFPDGDLTLVAEHDSIGRSRAIRLPTAMPGQHELTLTLEQYGSLTGVLRRGAEPAESVIVWCQSTTTPGAIYSVSSGPDGAYRFDKLAPDVYKVSATVGMPMTGMKYYSKQVEVPAGKQVTIDLAVEPGNVTLDVTVVASNGQVGVANVYIVTGSITARTQNELSLKMAAAGPGASQWVIIRNGEPARFAEVAPGTYSACAVPYPEEVRGMSAMGYGERHGDTLLAFCTPVAVGAAPATQALTLPTELPPFVPDGAGSGSGSATP